MGSERRVTARRAGLVLALLPALAGCGDPAHEEPAAAASEPWSVTAWGRRFEVFPELGPLTAGRTAVAYTHVTRLDGFEPFARGRVEVVLAGPDGEQVFADDEPVRPGVFAVRITPERGGDFDLAFRVRDEAGLEELRGGRVRVGEERRPGGLLVAPAPKGGEGGEPIELPKEQQWGSDFATAWVRAGSLAGSVSGLATVRPPAAAEVTIGASVAGVLQPPSGPRSWPFVGREVERGQPLFRLSPLVASGRSLAGLEADLEAAETELTRARDRLARLEELLALEAASRREVEEARARERMLEARRRAAARDLEAARSVRTGGASGQELLLRAPFPGVVARVDVTPGEAVEAGAVLARLVGTERAWVEVEVPPSGARRLGSEGVRGLVLRDPEAGALRIEEGLRLVSIAPEVSPGSGTVAVLVEVPRPDRLAFGATFEALVLTAVERQGVVIPSTALIDDGGVPVVYLQLAGESFVRQQVQPIERQGGRLLVGGLRPGQRLVTRGGNTIRRASLLAAGEPHGHVH